jgi:hypothetical protein
MRTKTMRTRALAVAGLAVLAVTGCGGSSPDGANAKRFSGERRDVARVVDALQSAARSGDAHKICSELLTGNLAAEIGARVGTSCEAQVKRQLVSDGETLAVQRLLVRGTVAVATVREQNRNISQLVFRRQGGDWRLSGIE